MHDYIAKSTVLNFVQCHLYSYLVTQSYSYIVQLQSNLRVFTIHLKLSNCKIKTLKCNEVLNSIEFNQLVQLNKLILFEVKLLQYELYIVM